MWLADTPTGSDDGRPHKQSCTDCVKAGCGSVQETLDFLQYQAELIASRVFEHYSQLFDKAAGGVMETLHRELVEIDRRKEERIKAA